MNTHSTYADPAVRRAIAESWGTGEPADPAPAEPGPAEQAEPDPGPAEEVLAAAPGGLLAGAAAKVAEARRESAAARSGSPVVLMADTVRPERIPDSWGAAGHAVLAYRDGAISQWPIEQIRRFRKVDGITVTGAPAMARQAREVDVERYDATVEAVPPFLDARAELGHHDGTVYCSRSTLVPLFQVLDGRRPRLHIATLDGRGWTPAELAAEIYDTWGLRLDPAWIWAIQAYPATPVHPYDVSLVYGMPDFWDPQIARAAESVRSPWLFNEGLRPRAMPHTGDVAVFLRGQEDTFKHHLVRAIANAGPADRDKLAFEYPGEVQVVSTWEHLWKQGGPPTYGDLYEALTDQNPGEVTSG